MDDLQKKRLENDVARVGDVAQEILDKTNQTSFDGFRAELRGMGWPVQLDVARLATMAYMSLLTGCIVEWKIPRSSARFFIERIEHVDPWESYWIDPAGEPNSEMAIFGNQMMRLTRACFDEIWMVYLMLDQEYGELNRSLPRDDEGSISEEDARKLDPYTETARVKAVTLCHFLIDFAYDSHMPVDPEVAPDPVV